MNRVNDGPNINTFVQWVTDAQPVHAGAQFLIKPVSDAFLHQEAGSGAADLALIEPDGVNQPFYCRIDVSVVKDDVGRLTAQFEGECFAGASCGLANFAPH